MPPKHINVTSAVQEFYILQAISTISKVEPFRHSHERWRNDFERYKKAFTEHLAVAIFDYTTLVVFGEMRNAEGHASKYNMFVPGGVGRSSAYHTARKYTPISILEAGVSLFREAKWESGYGGDKWAVIAETALKKAQGLPGWCVPEVFIDRCVDLTHNGSIYFDKIDANIFFLEDFFGYKVLLDKKRYCTPGELIEYYGWLSKDIVSLANRAKTLGIIDPAIRAEIYDSNYTMTVLNYEPIHWGTKWIPNAIEDNCDYNEYNEDEEDDYGEEECFEEVYLEEEYEYEKCEISRS